MHRLKKLPSSAKMKHRAGGATAGNAGGATSTGAMATAGTGEAADAGMDAAISGSSAAEAIAIVTGARAEAAISARGNCHSRRKAYASP